MNTQFTIDVRAIQRVVCVIVAALLLVAGLPLLQPKRVSADQFAERSIQMSDASPSGTSITTGVGSGTNVTYRVSFTPTNQASSMVLDFCIDSPIISDTCTAPTDMAGPTGIANVSGTIGGTGWTITTTGSQVKIQDDGVSGHDMQAGVPQVFDLTGITNPSTVDAVTAGKVGAFYARMYTYANNTQGTYASPTSIGNYVDYGGTALSLNTAITITARVQESLTFCVTSSDPTQWTANGDCRDPAVSSNPPALILGQGSPTAVLDSSRVDTGTIYSQLSTNATHGAVINLRNNNTSCGGLSADNGTTCAIPAKGGIGAITAGTAAFGLFVSGGTARPADGGGNGAGTGTTTATAAFNDGTHTTVPGNVYYGMPNTGADAAQGNVINAFSGNVTSTFGSTLAYTTVPVYRVENAYTFAATSALTTPAGIYTANMSMIATGTF